MLKLAATIFTGLFRLLLVIAMLSSVTILLGSGLRFSGIPVGRNCATSLEGWWEVFGLDGVGFACGVTVGDTGFVLYWGRWLVGLNTTEDELVGLSGSCELVPLACADPLIDLSVEFEVVVTSAFCSFSVRSSTSFWMFASPVRTGLVGFGRRHAISANWLDILWLLMMSLRNDSRLASWNSDWTSLRRSRILVRRIM